MPLEAWGCRSSMANRGGSAEPGGIAIATETGGVSRAGRSTDISDIQRARVEKAGRITQSARRRKTGRDGRHGWTAC